MDNIEKDREGHRLQKGIVMEKTQLIEKTSKGLKTLKMLTVLGIFAGVGICFGNPPIGILVIILSIIGLIGVKIATWWYHG